MQGKFWCHKVEEIWYLTSFIHTVSNKVYFHLHVLSYIQIYISSLPQMFVKGWNFENNQCYKFHLRSDKYTQPTVERPAVIFSYFKY